MPTVYGVTPQGFQQKRLADILSSINGRLALITDPVSGEAFVPGNDPVVGQVSAIFAAALAEVWEVIASSAVQFDPRYNTGAAQSGTAQINGVLRLAGTATEIEVDMTGTAGQTVTAGSLVSTPDGSYTFRLKSPVTFSDPGGTATGVFVNTVKGLASVPEGAALNIVTPMGGWRIAVAGDTVVVGNDEETDTELRRRQQESTALTSRTQSESVYSAVVNTPGVTYARVYERNDVEDEVGGMEMLGKSISVVVLGGDDAAVALAIRRASPEGIRYNGTTTEEVVDPVTGITYEVKFYRPTPVEIEVEVELTQTGPDFPSGEYAQLVKDAVVAYATGGAGSLGLTAGFDRDGFIPGEDVHVSVLYTPCNSIPGQYVSSLLICEEGGTPGTAAVTIDWDEVAHFDPDNITVTLA